MQKNLSLPIITKVPPKQRKHFAPLDKIQPFLDFPPSLSTSMRPTPEHKTNSEEWKFKPSQRVYLEVLNRKTLDMVAVERGTQMRMMKDLCANMFRKKPAFGSVLQPQEDRLRAVRERVLAKREQKMIRLKREQPMGLSLGA